MGIKDGAACNDHSDMTESADHCRDPEASAVPAPGLTRDEDDDLRRLHWLAQNATLSPLLQKRMFERRVRDRRSEVRQPREFATTPHPEPEGGAA